MKWIKQNYDRFLLALFAFVLLACAGLLISDAFGFKHVFASLSDNVPRKQGLGISVDQNDVTEKEHKLSAPDLWVRREVKDEGYLPLFVSVPYIEDHGQLINPLRNGSAMLHPPIPNVWFLQNKQDLLAPGVLNDDTDGDGFSTLDEFNGKTDPNDKNSHPPYWTKLFLRKLVRIPFHLRFDARNGAVFQVNTTDDENAPTQFVHMNDVVKLGNFTFKVTKFEEKTDKSQGFKKDVSELTLTNMANGEVIVLPKQVDVDSPTTYAQMAYLWTGKDFGVQKDKEFTLAPEDNVKYKVLELNEQQVRVLKEDENKELKIPLVGTPR